MLHVCVLNRVFRKIVEKLFRAQLSALQGFKVYNFTKKVSVTYFNPFLLNIPEPPENIKKPFVLSFRGVRKRTLGRNRLAENFLKFLQSNV